MIRYIETYEIVTPESAELGEAADRGFIDEAATASFREMVMMLELAEPSFSPFRPERFRVGDWFTVRYNEDYRTGAVEYRKLYPADERAARYMAKAWIYANK